MEVFCSIHMHDSVKHFLCELQQLLWQVAHWLFCNVAANVVLLNRFAWLKIEPINLDRRITKCDNICNLWLCKSCCSD